MLATQRAIEAKTIMTEQMNRLYESQLRLIGRAIQKNKTKHLSPELENSIQEYNVKYPRVSNMKGIHEVLNRLKINFP